MTSAVKSDAAKAEDLLRQKFRAKCRFRAIVRMVMANAYWMADSVEAYQGDDVKKRVEQAMRQPGKAKQDKAMLNLNDKELLNKPASERTEQEKKYLYRIIGGLKCFKRYPNIVKKKLAAVTYFRYYGPGRVIVRQNHDAHALYFIMSGDVVVSVLIYDQILQQTNSVDVGMMTVGMMFGEVSLLHNIPRTATCTTLGHCEFLMLLKDDFKSVLQDSVQKQWDEIKLAMSEFSYFKDLDPVSRREACIVSRMKAFKAGDTMLGDNKGIPNFIYFVLSGRCQMIETLQVFVTTRLGKQFYRLYDPYIEKEESEPDFEKKYFKTYNTHAFEINKDVEAEKEPDPVATKFKISIDEAAMTSMEKNRRSVISGSAKEEKRARTSKSSGMARISNVTRTTTNTRSSQSSMLSRLILPPRCSEEFESMDVTDVTLKLETFFMQVCQFLPGSTFGFGENMRDRRIVALTDVDCLLMPKVWLLQRNTINIWTRVQHYLEQKIPTKTALFKEFVNQRKWEEYKKAIVEEVISKSKAVNFTTAHDVPYSIRLEEKLDI